MASGGIKGISAVVIAWLTYIDNTLTPLFWVLLALIALDLFLNAHKEGQQFYKIGSMAITLGVPSYIASNVDNPNLGKYLVALMCLVYLQIVVPELLKRVKSLTLSNDPKENAIDQAALNTLIQKVSVMEQAAAEKIVSEKKTPTIIEDGGQEGGK